MTMANVALVGCAHIHTPDFVRRLRERPDVTVLYVWDHDAARAQKYAHELGAAVATDVNAIWQAPEVAATIICSETNRHQELVLAAATAQKHLFVEKPLGLGAADAYAMADAVEQAGVLFQTGYFMRSHPIYLFLREQIGLGHFGTVSRIRHSNCHDGSLRGLFDSEWAWMADPAVAGVGAFGDLGTLSLDILLWLMGDVTQVTAALGVAIGRYPNGDEYGEGLLQFANGAIGTLAAGWVDVANPVTFLVSGTEGHAHVVGNNLYFKSKHVPGTDGQTPWTELSPALPHAFDLFLEAISGQTDVPLVPVREAAGRSAVMEALYQAASQGQWIRPQTGR
jgi:predicted dehydrogenase